MIADLAIAPVKGMRLCPSAELELAPSEPRGDRAFLVVDTDRELLLSQRNPDLLRVLPRWEPDRELLTLHFPDGAVVSGTPEPGGEARTTMYDGRPVPS